MSMEDLEMMYYVIMIILAFYTMFWANHKK